MSPHPLVGKKAPPITLPNQDGEQVTIEPGTTGTPLAVFFYPASGSLGCTKEACAFRDVMKGSEVFQRSRVQVVGISGDAVSKQKKFVDQNGLPYPVLSDEAGVARKAYDVKKSFLGMSEGRVTYFITADGVVKDTCSSTINFSEHAKFVRKMLEAEEKNSKEQKTEQPEAQLASGANVDESGVQTEGAVASENPVAEN